MESLPASHETRSAAAGPVVAIVVVASSAPLASYELALSEPGPAATLRQMAAPNRAVRG